MKHKISSTTWSEYCWILMGKAEEAMAAGFWLEAMLAHERAIYARARAAEAVKRRMH